MRCIYRLAAGLGVLLLGAASANAQDIPPPRPTIAPPGRPIPQPAQEAARSETGVPESEPASSGSYSDAGEILNVPNRTAPTHGAGLEAESLPAELEEDISQPLGDVPWGPTPMTQASFLADLLGLGDPFADTGIRTFGWAEAGYTGASTGTGILSVQTRQNRYGNNFLFNQIGWTIQKPLAQDRFNLGFNIVYFAGADAALGAAKGGINGGSTNTRFGQDFRFLELTAHLPVLTEGGVDFKIGRMNTIIGYNGFLSPYRPFYSSDYQFFYSQDGAFTGWLADLHVTDRLDVWNGMTLGANTFFVQRSSRSICYIGQVNYWLQEERRTRLTASVYAGPNAIFAAPGLAGDYVSMVELRAQQDWTPRFTQIVQNNMGWDANTPKGTGSWYGLYTIGIFHLTPKLDINLRAEWFEDANGTRTGIATNYSEVTGGLNWHPIKHIEIRPEIRGDFAGAPAFGVDNMHTHRGQLTGGVSFLVKF